MTRFLILAAVFTSTAPAFAQADPHAGHDMGAMQMPTGGEARVPDPHAGHDMSSTAMPATGDAPGAGESAGHDVAAMDHAETGTALEAGSAPAPALPADRWAERFYAPAAMQRARAISRKEHGGGTFGQIMFNLAEYQVRGGRDGYRWDGEGWFGGDIDRLTVKTEGEGTLRERVDAAEIQALWSHALDPYWNLQAGGRIDFQPGPVRTYATIGIEGLAPYWFEVEGALFLSDKGDLLGRVEAYYDQRITQRFVLQPRIEANLAAQDVRANQLGSGLTDLEIGLRLRYERTREFAPYVGVSWERQFGDTARFARRRGDDTGGFSLVAGVRTWF